MKDIVQIAGINNASEAKMVAKCGADYIGFPLRLDAKKPDISEGEAAKIIEGLKPPTYGVAITYLTDPHEIVELCRSLHCDIVQLHGDVSFGELVRLRSIAPKLRIIKALIVQGSNLPSLQAEVPEEPPARNTIGQSAASSSSSRRGRSSSPEASPPTTSARRFVR
jgi:phosphoribosylanthranilate isomerase